MIKFAFPSIDNILCLGAHSDDIEIGCGATIKRLIELYPKSHIRWVVFSSDDVRATEARNSADLFLAKAGSYDVLVMSFRDGFFPWHGAEIKERFEVLKGEIQPDLIFTHYGRDYHQDHRVISELTWNTWRNRMILEYEIPKYDGDLGAPNFFMPLEEDAVQEKIDHICASFSTQTSKPWFTENTFKSLLRLRGIESGASEEYAEAFYCRKFVCQ